MPTYEYKCLDCGRRFEVFQSMTDEPLTECESCNGRVKRLIGAGAGLIFKGSGFYSTDYRSKSYSEQAKKEKTGESSSSASTKSEPKTGSSAEAPKK